MSLDADACRVIEVNGADWDHPGADPRLDKAIELAVAALAERPAATAPSLPPPVSRLMGLDADACRVIEVNGADWGRAGADPRLDRAIGLAVAERPAATPPSLPPPVSRLMGLDADACRVIEVNRADWDHAGADFRLNRVIGLALVGRPAATSLGVAR